MDVIGARAQSDFIGIVKRKCKTNEQTWRGGVCVSAFQCFSLVSG